jgi:hypothetical protein
MSGPANPFAFPSPDDGRPSDGFGMDLRDWFAGRAMQGIVGSIDGEDNYQRLRRHAADECMSVSQWIARDAYKQADAMLAAREPTTSAQAPAVAPQPGVASCGHPENSFECVECAPF